MTKNSTISPLEYIVLIDKTARTVVDVCEVHYKGTGTMSPSHYVWHKIKTFVKPSAAESYYQSVLDPANEECIYYEPSGVKRTYEIRPTDERNIQNWRDAAIQKQRIEW
ncbi:TPA: hypothetical protein HA251_08710 [Candidatus Woesearchaeota archaeon]|nr:hypothetical protein [Candidatus Woesearchaeota archaeon]